MKKQTEVLDVLVQESLELDIFSPDLFGEDTEVSNTAGGVAGSFQPEIELYKLIFPFLRISKTKKNQPLSWQLDSQRQIPDTAPHIITAIRGIPIRFDQGYNNWAKQVQGSKDKPKLDCSTVGGTLQDGTPIISSTPIPVVASWFPNAYSADGVKTIPANGITAFNTVGKKADGTVMPCEFCVSNNLHGNCAATISVTMVVYEVLLAKIDPLTAKYVLDKEWTPITELKGLGDIPNFKVPPIVIVQGSNTTVYSSLDRSKEKHLKVSQSTGTEITQAFQIPSDALLLKAFYDSIINNKLALEKKPNWQSNGNQPFIYPFYIEVYKGDLTAPIGGSNDGETVGAFRVASDKSQAERIQATMGAISLYKTAMEEGAREKNVPFDEISSLVVSKNLKAKILSAREDVKANLYLQPSAPARQELSLASAAVVESEEQPEVPLNVFEVKSTSAFG